jgi:hypothetical protein
MPQRRAQKSARPTHARPVFVVGAPRSGTSVLTWSLGQHPNLLPLEETNWLATLAVDLGAAYLLGTQRGERSHLSAMGISADALFESVGQSIDRLILDHRDRYEERSNEAALRDPARVHAGFTLSRSHLDPKTRWVDGTPENSFATFGLRLLFPDATFIHIVRDVRSVVRSMMTFADFAGQSIVESEQAAYDYWLRSVRACLAAEEAFGPRVVLRLRHADLVETPDQVVRRCCDLIGEPFDASALTTLQQRINSSPGASAYQLGSGSPNPAIVAEAEALSRQLLERPDQPLGPSSGKRDGLAAAFWERARFVGSLDADRLNVLRALADAERTVEERTAWARSLDEELLAARAAIDELQQTVGDRTAWALRLDEELAAARQRIGDLEAALRERSSAGGQSPPPREGSGPGA